MFKVKLSKVQKDVVDAFKLGLFLWTDEGLLKLVDGDYRSNWYKYKLNEEEIKNEIF